jgi:hypothetical protein
MIGDTGSTANFCTIDLPVENKTAATEPLYIYNPNGGVMQSTHIAELVIPKLPKSARVVHVVPALSTKSLISIGQLCDAGCIATFDATTATISYENETVLVGHRTEETKLWHLELPLPDHTAYAAGSAKPADLVALSHATLFSPALSTLEKALNKGYLTNFPGLDADSLRKYPPNSIPMVKGHLDQSRKNQQSTKPARMAKVTVSTVTEDDGGLPSEASTAEDDEFPPGLSDDNDTNNSCFYADIVQPTGQIYTDLTGKFIAPSSNGNNYLFILYDYDSNCILAEPMKNRTAQCILGAYKTLHTKLVKAGLKPKLQRLDNECSKPSRSSSTKTRLRFSLSLHRRNAAERAIRTFKNHFIAGLCSTDKNFPLHLWDAMVSHAIIALNLLRGSRINPNHSAWSQYHGPFDFKRTPLGVPGCRLLVHEKPDKRTTWSPHASDGWYIGPAMESYRCHKV